MEIVAGCYQTHELNVRTAEGGTFRRTELCPKSDNLFIRLISARQVGDFESKHKVASFYRSAPIPAKLFRTPAANCNLLVTAAPPLAIDLFTQTRHADIVTGHCVRVADNAPNRRPPPIDSGRIVGSSLSKTQLIVSTFE